MDKRKVGFTRDGIVYLTRKQARELTGLSYPTFDSKVKKFNIKFAKQPAGGVWFRLLDIQEAIKLGYFEKYIKG